MHLRDNLRASRQFTSGPGSPRNPLEATAVRARQNWTPDQGIAFEGFDYEPAAIPPAFASVCGDVVVHGRLETRIAKPSRFAPVPGYLVRPIFKFETPGDSDEDRRDRADLTAGCPRRKRCRGRARRWARRMSVDTGTIAQIRGRLRCETAHKATVWTLCPSMFQLIMFS